MDEVDLANMHLDRELNILLDLMRNRMGNGPAVQVCITCGDPIPRARQLAVAGCVRCIGCQRLYEALAR